MIFCVEDEQNICELEVYTLQSVGMEAQGCGSGRELFALLEKQVPELIVLDIMLPDEDGVSILRRLRADKRYANIPVIMATAKGSEFDKVKGLEQRCRRLYCQTLRYAGDGGAHQGCAAPLHSTTPR